jgi:hypothetical protein
LTAGVRAEPWDLKTLNKYHLSFSLFPLTFNLLPFFEPITNNQ